MRKFIVGLSKRQKGFTLIELIVVIAIIAILAAIILIALGQATKKARDSRRKADMKNIATQLENYASDNNGQYPATGDGLRILEDDKYFDKLPTDPRTRNNYWYASDATRTGYLLRTDVVLENKNDPIYKQGDELSEQKDGFMWQGNGDFSTLQGQMNNTY